MRFQIKGTGSYLPQKEVSNDMLSEIMDTNDEWISSRTGIRSRRIAVKETTTDLAAAAAKKALEDSDLTADQIDLIIVATFTPEQSQPGTACMVQAALGCINAVAFDLNAACSGFLFAMSTAQAYFEAGIYKNALLVGAEVISKVLDWEDRGCSILFGDGAGAAVLSAVEGVMFPMLQGSDGIGGQVITCADRGNCNPWMKPEHEPGAMKMEGQAVFKFAVRKVPECIEQILDREQLQADQIDWYLLHQANKRILASVAKRLKVSLDKFPMNLDQYGNTSAASIPILLDECNKKQLFHSGDKVMLSGFGAGLTWGAMLVEWL